MEANLPFIPSWKYSAYRLIWAGIDLIFPPNCVGCSKAGFRWCSDCRRNVIVISGPICDICGLPQNASGLCSNCETERPSYNRLRSWSVFADPVKEALHRLKYRRDIVLGDTLAAQMVDFLRQLQWPIEIVIPIPLGKS
jgi:competence protein ComFC